MKIGISQISQPTPKIVQWIFGVSLVLANVATFIIAGDDTIPDATKVRIGVYVQGFVMALYGISQVFGIPIKKDNEESVEQKLEEEKK